MPGPLHWLAKSKAAKRVCALRGIPLRDETDGRGATAVGLVAEES